MHGPYFTYWVILVLTKDRAPALAWDRRLVASDRSASIAVGPVDTDDASKRQLPDTCGRTSNQLQKLFLSKSTVQTREMLSKLFVVGMFSLLRDSRQCLIDAHNPQ
jgi:hypothetical protein